MTTKYTPAVKKGMLNTTGADEQFNLSKLYIFRGAEPATAAEALNMATTHTELVVVTNNATATGLTFASAIDPGVLPKTEAEIWKGVNTFDGFEDTESVLAPVFYRLCAAADDGRGVADATTGYRLQGTVGGPGSGADLVLGATTLTAGADQVIQDYQIELL